MILCHEWCACRRLHLLVVCTIRSYLDAPQPSKWFKLVAILTLANQSDLLFFVWRASFQVARTCLYCS